MPIVSRPTLLILLTAFFAGCQTQNEGSNPSDSSDENSSSNDSASASTQGDDDNPTDDEDSSEAGESSTESDGTLETSNGDNSTDTDEMSDESQSTDSDSTTPSDESTGEDSNDDQEFANDCEEALADAIAFYNGQRCGDAHNWLIADNEFGSHCHDEDGAEVSADLSGGWHDAGDYIKFTLTQSATAYQLLKAYDAFPQSFKDRNDYEGTHQSNGIPDVLDEVRHVLDYLEKMLLEDGRFVSRVGSDKDHNDWETSPHDTVVSKTPRTVFAQGKADVAGMSAAALALGSRLFASFDEKRAASYLDAAIAQHAFAIKSENAGVTDDSFYPDDTFKDSLFCGASELFATTKDEAYKILANSLNDELARTKWVLDWANPVDPCRHTLQASGAGDGETNLVAEVEATYLTAVSQDEKVKGLAYFGLKWGTLRYANNSAFSAGLAWNLAKNADKRQLYADFVASQVEFTLGKNPYDRSFVVGVGKHPPTEPHHQLAYGQELGDFPQKGDKPRFEIKGAMVGGPSIEEGYEDNVANYVTNEVTIDYNAALVGSLAALAAMERADQFSGAESFCRAIHDAR
jgi:endoglucanase